MPEDASRCKPSRRLQQQVGIRRRRRGYLRAEQNRRSIPWHIALRDGAESDLRRDFLLLGTRQTRLPPSFAAGRGCARNECPGRPRPATGPPLYGVIGRAKGSVEGFDYSEAIKSKGGKWTYADLDQFLADPKAYAQGTKMAFAGERDPVKRADIIGYLRTLADAPPPKPPDDPEGPPRK
jgi:cytochrome c2